MNYLLVVEDSRTDRMFIRRTIKKAFSDLEIRFADDPFEAREMISQQRPTAVLLDLSLPKMSGSDFLGALMRNYPLPVIVVSGNCQIAGSTTRALVAMGAIAVIEKPLTSDDNRRFESQLVFAIESAVGAHVSERSKRRDTVKHAIGRPANCNGQSSSSALSQQSGVDIIAFGSSTGGPKALNDVLSVLPANCPPVVIAQHIAGNIVGSLVERLDANSRLKVVLARDNVRLQRGYAYVATPLSHLEVVDSSRLRLAARGDGEAFAPNINRLFRSLTDLNPERVVACILTGMGNDGAEGLLELRRLGGRTIAQDESTSVVFGMPARAAEVDAADEILPIDEIPACIMRWCSHEHPELAMGDS